MARAVGIDLGTTNSAVAVLEGGEPTIIANAEGGRTTPSVVAFSKSGDVLVGEIAKRQAVTNVDRTIRSVKRHMGTDWKSDDIDGKQYTAQEISARILQKLKRDAEAYLGETVTDAVITVPAYFDDHERQATKEAGEIAGLNVLRIINEPTAAALAYGLDKGKEDELILVFDLGGGTFDVSLLEVGKDPEDGFSTIQVKATSGDNRLGGDDWDDRIVTHLLSTVKNSTGVDLSKDKIAMQRLRDAAEQAKKELSSSTSATINLQYLSMSENGPIHLDETISRAQFEQLTKDLLDRCKAPFAKVIKDAGIKLADIDHGTAIGKLSEVALAKTPLGGFIDMPTRCQQETVAVRDGCSQFRESRSPILHIIFTQDVRAECVVDPEEAARIIRVPSCLEVPRAGEREDGIVGIFRCDCRNDGTDRGLPARWVSQKQHDAVLADCPYRIAMRCGGEVSRLAGANTC